MRILLLVCVTAFVFSSCENLQVNKATDTIVGEWQLVKYEKNAIDETTSYASIFTNYHLSFVKKDAVYSETYDYFGTTPVYIDGIFIFSDHADVLTLSDENQTRVYNIVTLTNSALTLELLGGTDTEVFFFEPL